MLTKVLEAWKETLDALSPKLKKRKQVATKNLLSFNAIETYYVLDNPQPSLSEELILSGNFVSANTPVQYAVSPWIKESKRSGFLGRGSLKFAVTVSFYLLYIMGTQAQPICITGRARNSPNCLHSI